MWKTVRTTQKETPTAGDFVNLVEKDMQEFGVTYEEIKQCSKVDLKKKLKVDVI